MASDVSGRGRERARAQSCRGHVRHCLGAPWGSLLPRAREAGQGLSTLLHRKAAWLFLSQHGWREGQGRMTGWACQVPWLEEGLQR